MKQVPWLKDKAIFDGYLVSYGRFKALAGGPKAVTPKRGPGDEVEAEWEDERHPSEEGEASEDSPGDEPSEDDDMKDRIKKLRAELKKAEDDAAARRSGKKSKKKRTSGPSRGSAKDKKKKPDEPRKGRVRSPGDRVEKKDKKKRRRSSESGSRRGKRDPGAKKRKKHHPEDSGGSDETSERELFKSKKPADVALKSNEQDRGPFGGGVPVKFKNDEGDDSSSESSFRQGPSTSARSSQQRLLAYTNKYPGRLASRMLLKMEQATARGVEGPEVVQGNRTPVVAMNHILTILLPSLGQKAGLRSTRELKTLGSILDHLARGSPSKAADVVAQRIKAVERASHETHWGSAQYLELLPPENTMLLEKDEEMYVTKEYMLEQKLRDYDRRGGQRREVVVDGKGKSKGAKGKTKDRDKGDRGAWDKTEKPGKKPEA